MNKVKQRLIIGYAMQNENKISLDEAILIKGVNTYYCNERFYIGNILSRMVKNGILKRINPGRFQINKVEKEYKKQTKLF